MFDKIYEWILRRVISVRKRDLGLDKYDNSKDVERWTAIYEGRAPWVNLEPRKEENEEYITGELNTGAAIASEMARLATIEFESKITGGARADYVNQAYQKVLPQLRLNLEYALAKGGMVMRPYHNDKTGEIFVEFIQNGEFIPLAFDDSGKMTSVAFTEVVKAGNDYYTKIETHKLYDDGTYTIENKAWITEGNGYEAAAPITLSVVEEWKDLPPLTTFGNVKVPLFGHFKPPFANNENSNSELGSSIFTRVERLIERLDRQHSLMIHEYKATRAKIFIDKMHTNNLTSSERRRFIESDVYEILDGTQTTMEGEDSIFKVIGPDIRNESINAEINRISRAIESGVGLSYGFLSEVTDTSKTATEIIASKQRSYSTVKDIQKALQNALEDLVYSIMIIESSYGLAGVGKSTGLAEDYEVSYDWDDSIIESKEERLKGILTGVEQGHLHPKYYLMEKLGMTEKQAIKAVEEAREFNNPSQ